jgi:hypothetical protein
VTINTLFQGPWNILFNDVWFTEQMLPVAFIPLDEHTKNRTHWINFKSLSRYKKANTLNIYCNWWRVTVSYDKVRMWYKALMFYTCKSMTCHCSVFQKRSHRISEMNDPEKRKIEEKEVVDQLVRLMKTRSQMISRAIQLQNSIDQGTMLQKTTPFRCWTSWLKILLPKNIATSKPFDNLNCMQWLNVKKKKFKKWLNTICWHFDWFHLIFYVPLKNFWNTSSMPVPKIRR